MKQFILYCFCGGIGVSTDYLIYYLALINGVWYQSANLLGYLAGTLISFFLNRLVTFGVKDKISQRLLTFLMVATVGYISSGIVLWILVDLMSVKPEIAKLITLPLIVIIQYTMNKRFTFNRSL